MDQTTPETNNIAGTQRTVMCSVKNSKERVFKVIVIGDSNVGKTTLTYRFCESKFLNTSESTIGVDFRSKKLQLDGQNIVLQLWDTAGQERYRMSMVRHYYRNTDAVVLVYDVTDPNSFISLKKWVEESNNNCLPDIPKILVGNKCDGQVRVSTNEAQKFADQHSMPLFETSARLDSQCDNVEAIFLTLAHKLKDNKKFLPDDKDKINGTKIVNDTTKSAWSCYC